MLDLKFIRENPGLVKQAILDKNEKVDVDDLLSRDGERRSLLQEVEQLKCRRNTASVEIGRRKKNKEDDSGLLTEMKEISAKIKDMDAKLDCLDQEMKSILLSIPNIPHASAPQGKDSSANQMLREWGEKKELPFKGLDHLQLGEHLDILDFKRGAKIAGSGFPLYKGLGARLEMALIHFMLDFHVQKHGYIEIFPPFLVNRDAATGTGQLPKSEEQMYLTEKDDLFLIPTAEVPVTNIYREEILPGSALPLCHTAYSACFRREAGSYGKDTKGFLRVHQFNKVELVKFVKPETSYDEHEKLVREAEAIVQALALPFRTMLLCRGDLSFAAAKCYDLEAWAPVEKKYLEISSCSNFEDFQARRANIRFRDSDGKIKFVHTLNGSGLATSRIMATLLETYQTERKTVMVPEVLRPYMGGTEEIIQRKIF